MSEISFRKILWNNQDGRDEIWTSFVINNEVYCAWGRLGGRLSFKDHGIAQIVGRDRPTHTLLNTIPNLENQKINKGYKEIDNFMLFSLFPDFEQKVEEELVLKLMAGKIK